MFQTQRPLKAGNQGLAEGLMHAILKSLAQEREPASLQRVEQERDVLEIEDSVLPCDAIRQDSAGLVSGKGVTRSQHEQLQIRGPFHLNGNDGPIGELAAQGEATEESSSHVVRMILECAGGVQQTLRRQAACNCLKETQACHRCRSTAAQSRLHRDITSYFDSKRRETFTSLICEKPKGTFDVVLPIQLFVDELETEFSVPGENLHTQVEIQFDGNGQGIESRSQVCY